MKIILRPYKLMLLVCSLSLLLVQCRKDEIVTERNPQPIGNLTDISFLIAVSDEDGQLLPSASIQIEDQVETFSADQNGVISIDKITIPRVGIKADITSDGFETQTIRLVGSPNAVTSLDVTLTSLVTKIISTGQSGEIANGNTLQLPDVLETKNGDRYTGPVTVTSKQLAEDQLLSILQGNMQAIDQDGQYKLLGTTSMLYIGMNDDAGNELVFPQGKNATITIPLTVSQLTIDPANLEVWSLDSQIATWISAGSVSIDQDKFTLEIDKTSWINISPAYQFYQPNVSIKDGNGRAIPHLEVQFYVDDYLLNQAYINNANEHNLSLPIQQDISIRYAYDGREYSQSIGTLDGNQMQVDIILQDLTASQITGNVIDCQIQPITSGYGIIERQNTKSVFPIVSGQYTYLNILEDHNLTLVQPSTSASTSITVDNLDEDIQLETVTLCNQPLATISGYVLLDADENGTGEVPLDGQVITLSSDNQSQQTTTSTDGYYEFSYLQEDSIYIQVLIDTDQHVLFQSGDESPESGQPEINITRGFAVKNLTPIDDQDNNFILVNAGTGKIAGTYFADTNNDGIGDQALEWQAINTFTEEQITYVGSDGTFATTLPNGHGELITGFYDYLADYDTTPDPDGDDSAEGPNGTIPYFINTAEEDEDNNFVINLDFAAIVFQVLEDTDGDGIGDIPITEGQINIKHLTGGSASVSTSLELSSSRYPKVELGIGFAELHEVTLTLPFAHEIISIEDLSPDNNPQPTSTMMNIRTDGAEWDAGNTFVIRTL